MKPDTERLNKYKLYTNILRNCLKTAEIRHYNNLFENNKKSTFNLWKNLGNIINPKKCRKSTVINKLLVNGKFVTGKQSISNGINDFLCNIGEGLQSGLLDRGDAYTKYLPPKNPYSFYLEPIDADKIKTEI